MYSIKDENRFWSKVETGDVDECWVWLSYIGRNRYGQIRINGKMIKAHRFSFQLFHNRLIEDNMCLLHKCDNPACVNPHHLSEGTQCDNMTDMKNKGRGNKTKGEKHHKSKLTEKQVLEIRAKYAKGGITYKVLGIEYLQNSETIARIVRRETWTHI